MIGCLVVWGGLCAAAAAGVAVIGGTVHTLAPDAPGDGAQEGLTVLIDGGRIQAIGPDLDIPAGFERIDASGKVVTPGLIDAYTQIGLVEVGGEITTVDAQVTVRNLNEGALLERYPLGPAFDVRYALNPDTTVIPVTRMAGVTRAVVAPVAGNDPLAGWGAGIRLTDEAILVRPELALFGNIGAGSAALTGGSRGAVVQRIRYALEQARSFRPGGYEPGPGEYAAQDLQALQHFLQSGAPLVLTVHRASEIRQAVALGRDFDLSVVIHGASEAWKVAALLAEAEVPVLIDVLDNLPVSYDQLGARLDNATLLAQAGVTVLFTAEESQNARLLRQVAGNAVAEGLPWQSALAGMTRLPAETFGFEERTGTLTAGAPADLVIWNGDPLELTTWAERVMIDGSWVPMESRQTRLLERYRDLDGEVPYGYR
jgi:imidazolonepropionase-like amidohydrolase